MGQQGLPSQDIMTSLTFAGSVVLLCRTCRREGLVSLLAAMRLCEF